MVIISSDPVKSLMASGYTQEEATRIASQQSGATVTEQQATQQQQGTLPTKTVFGSLQEGQNIYATTNPQGDITGFVNITPKDNIEQGVQTQSEQVEVLGKNELGGVIIRHASGLTETVPPSVLGPITTVTSPIQTSDNIMPSDFLVGTSGTLSTVETPFGNIKFKEVGTGQTSTFVPLFDKQIDISSLKTLEQQYLGEGQWKTVVQKPSGEIVDVYTGKAPITGLQADKLFTPIITGLEPKIDLQNKSLLEEGAYGLMGSIISLVTSPVTLPVSLYNIAKETSMIGVGRELENVGNAIVTTAIEHPVFLAGSIAGGIIAGKIISSTLAEAGMPSLLQWENKPSTSTVEPMGVNVLKPEGINVAWGTEKVGSDITQTLKLFGKIPIGISRVSSFTGDLNYAAMGKDIIPSVAKGFGITQYRYDLLGMPFKYGYEAPFIETIGFQWTGSNQAAFSISQLTSFTGKNIGFGYSVSVTSSEGRAGTISTLDFGGNEWRPEWGEGLPYQKVAKQFSLQGESFSIKGSQFNEFVNLKDKTFGESLAIKPSGTITGNANILSIEPIITTGSASGSATIAPFKFDSSFIGGLGGATFSEIKTKLPAEFGTTAKITSTSLWISFVSKSSFIQEDIGIMRYPTGISNIITTTQKSFQPQNTQLANLQSQFTIPSQTSNINLKQLQNLGQTSIQGTSQFISQLQGQIQSQVQSQKQLQSLTNVTNLNNIITPTTPITPFFVPSFGTPDFGFGGGKKWGMGKIDLKTRYKPSLQAVLEGITAKGREPKLVSGFGFRPIYGKQRRIRL